MLSSRLSDRAAFSIGSRRFTADVFCFAIRRSELQTRDYVTWTSLGSMLKRWPLHSADSQRRQGPAMVSHQPASRSRGLLTFNGTLLKKKVQRFLWRHSWPRRSKSKSSPIGRPQPASNHSCRKKSGFWQGYASKLGISPATAANPLSQIHRSISFDDLTPMTGGAL